MRFEVIVQHPEVGDSLVHKEGSVRELALYIGRSWPNCKFTDLNVLIKNLAVYRIENYLMDNKTFEVYDEGDVVIHFTREVAFNAL